MSHFRHAPPANASANATLSAHSTSPAHLTIAKAQANDYLALTNIWERAVRATHDFLSETAILDIRNDIFDIYLRSMDVYVAFLVWNTPEVLPEEKPLNNPPVYPLPQKLQKKVNSGFFSELLGNSPLSNTPLANASSHGISLKDENVGHGAQEKHSGPKHVPLGFLGLQQSHIAMLFIDPPYHRMGLGETLIRHALALGAVSVDVNEQNPSAHAFYTKMGFNQYDRSALDAQGNPFPILHLRLPL